MVNLKIVLYFQTSSTMSGNALSTVWNANLTPVKEDPSVAPVIIEELPDIPCC